MVDSRLGAIIGGSIAGGLVLIAFVAVVIYLCLKQRRRRKERDQKEFRPLSAHNSPVHSQPSTLGHAGNGVGVAGPGPHPPSDPRLPKVGSNGLWLGTPGIYASSPSPAYFLGRPGAGAGPGPGGKLYQPHLQPYPAHGGVAAPAFAGGVQRASSETRLTPGSRQGPPGPPYLSGGGSHPRFYHSQQLPGLVPVYELVDPLTGSVYDVYQPGAAGSRTQLLDGGGSHGKHHHHSSKSKGKVERSHSDAHSHRHSKVDKHRAGSESRGSKTELLMSRAAETKQEQDNRAFSLSTEKLPEVTADKMAAVVTSATDSVKLLAKNRTDDQKTTVVPPKQDQDLDLPPADPDKPALDVFYRQPSFASTHSSPPSALVASVHLQEQQQQQQQQRKGSPPPVPEKTSTLHYTLDGDIYALPEKERGRRRGSDNPILARMQDMSLDRDEEGEEMKKDEEGEEEKDEGEGKGHREVREVTDIYETAETLLIRRVDEDLRGGDGGSDDFLSHGHAPVLNPIYQELDEVVGQAPEEGGHREVPRTGQENRGEGTSRYLHEDDPNDPLYAQVSAVAGSVTSHDDVGASGDDDKTGAHSINHRPSIDPDSAQGKQLSESETVRAFDFLDSYLSDDDDDGVESIHSIPKSPALSGRVRKMY